MIPSKYKPNNIIRRTWLYLMFLSVILLAVAVTSKSACDATRSRYSLNCSTIATTAGLAGLEIAMSLSSFALYQQWQVNNLGDNDLAKYGALLAFFSMIASIVNVVVTTTENLSKIGAAEGNVYFLCWGSFWVSLFLCLRYIDVFTLQESDDEKDAATAPMTRGSSRGSRSDDEELEGFRIETPPNMPKLLDQRLMKRKPVAPFSHTRVEKQEKSRSQQLVSAGEFPTLPLYKESKRSTTSHVSPKHRNIPDLL
jgi:hypothetical protein